MDKPNNAYVLRQSPSGVSLLETISLPQNVIVNGWSGAKGLLDEKDYWKFRDIVKATCYREDRDYRKAGYGAGTMWRFIRDMKPGDWIVVPHEGGVFYLAAIKGPAYYEGTSDAVRTDSCYRREVLWLNDKQPIARDAATSRLTSRMKTQQTSADASDLIDEIVQVLDLATSKRPLDADVLFARKLRTQMLAVVRREIQEGYMNERRFEELVQRIVIAVGAAKASIVPRLKDNGVDILADFPLGPLGKVTLGIQVKYHRGKTGKEGIDQLCNGLKEEGLTHGWLATSADFAPDVQNYLETTYAGSGLSVTLVDGALLAQIIVDYGLVRLLQERTK